MEVYVPSIHGGTISAHSQAVGGEGEEAGTVQAVVAGPCLLRTGMGPKYVSHSGVNE